MSDPTRPPLIVRDLDVVVTTTLGKAAAKDAAAKDSAGKDAAAKDSAGKDAAAVSSENPGVGAAPIAGGTVLLRGVSFVVEAGEALQLSGPSGSGKSTLLRCIATLHGEGGGVRLGETTPEQLGYAHWRRRVSYAHPGLRFRDPTVEEVLRRPFSFASSAATGRRAFDREQAEADVEALGLPGALSRDPRELSSGESQRVALVRAVAHRPDVALLDEPFSHLDDASRDRALEWLGEAQSQGMRLVIASHGKLPMAQLDLAQFGSARA